MLTRKTLDSRNLASERRRLLRSRSRNVDNGNLLPLPRIIEKNVNPESTLSARSQVQFQHGIVALLDATESLDTLRVLSQSAKAEIFETNHAAILDASKIHRVVPHVMVVLHVLISVGAVHEAGNAGRIIGVRGQAEDLEALAGNLGTRVLIAVGNLGRPLAVLGKGVVARNLHHATLGHRLLVPRNLDGSDHSLTSIAEATRRTMIEHIPLAVDFLQRAVGVMPSIGSDELRAVLIEYHAARVDQHAPRTPRAEGRVAEGIAQGRVAVAQSVLLA